MTEGEWLTCADPFAMLAQLRESAGWRKRQLYCLAVWGSVRHLLNADEYSRKGLAFLEGIAEAFDWRDDTAEDYEKADESLSDIDSELSNRYWDRIVAGEGELSDAMEAGQDWLLTSWDDPGCVEAGAAFAVASQALHLGAVPYLAGNNIDTTAKALSKRIEGYARAAGAKPRGTWQARQRLHAELVREVFGNPFRKPKVKRAWLACNDGIAAKLARAMDEERAFDRLGILGDALEDAGCDDEAVLTHCRGGGPHVRGCWVIDLVLGKE